MADEIMAYCVKEKAQRPMKDARQVQLKNGKHAMQGVCSVCGTKMTKFISVKKAPEGEKTESSSSPSTPMSGPGTNV